MEIEKEIHDTKYIRELIEYWDAYVHAVINEIYVGVGISLGLSEATAYDLAKNRTTDLKKSGFFKSLFDKFKSLFPHKIQRFRPKKGMFGDGTPMSEKQWTIFNNSVKKYWQKHTGRVAEDIAVKGFLLGRETTNFNLKKKPYKNKSLYQVSFDQYDGEIPSTIMEAYKKYDFDKSEKNILNKSFSNIAMYVQETNTEIQDAIRKQIQLGLDNNKSAIKIASDLYWNVQKDEELVNKYTAETLRRNWHRISQTEIASVYEAGILAQHEAQAMESLRDQSKAKYFIRTGGTCKWCRSKQGTLVRLIPSSVVEDTKNESLRAMGIIDPNTDIAIWPGKNNVGLKENDWQICCPAHPYNVATFTPINIETEWYNAKTGEVETRQVKKKFIPQQVDYSYRSKDEKEYRKPKVMGENLVRFNGNIYEAVPASVADKKLDAWRKDPRLPIPIQMDSPQYRRIFEAAE